MLKSNLSLLLSKKLKSFWENIYNLNDSDECLIIGSSSSLNKVNLNSFGEIPIITCNINIFLDIFQSLNCILVNICEPYEFTFNSKKYLKSLGLSKQNIDLILEVNKEIKNLKDINFLLNFSAFPQYFSYKNVSYFYKSCLHGVNKRTIPLDLLKFGNFSGAFYACLTSAYLAGFKKCFIFGFDSFTLEESSNTRFYNNIQIPKKNFINKNQKIYFEYMNKEMNLEVLTLPGQKSFLNSNEIKNKFKEITYQEKFNGLDLIKKEKRKLISDVSDEWLRKNITSS